METSKVKEMGVTVDNFFGNEPRMKAKQCNQKLAIFREFALATLNTLLKTKKGGKNSYITACDPFTGSGIAGLQWKKLFQSQAHVSMADHDDLSKLISNVTANNIRPSEMNLNSVRVPGDPFLSQEEDEVHIYRAEARSILSMESFQFVYLCPSKNGCEFIESAFHSTSHGGVVCFVVSDTSSFRRTPHVIKRQYGGASVIKTEYWKEMAARIVLASMASAAGRCNKGFIPLYVVSIEDYLLVCVRVSRGHASTESALSQLSQLMHCRFCEERVFVDSQLAPEENPYSKLICKCKQENVGKTAVLIGPMWKGPIFNTSFLREMEQHSTHLKLSHTFRDLTALLIAESCGNNSVNNKEKLKLSEKRSRCNGNGDATKQTIISPISEDSTCALKPAVDLHLADTTTTLQTASSDSSKHNHEVEGSRKRKLEEEKVEETEPMDVKKMHKETGLGKDVKEVQCQTVNVPFYYNANNKCKNNQLPKFDKLCSLLQKAGYQASRTHFDRFGIRTSATIEQFLTFLN